MICICSSDYDRKVYLFAGIGKKPLHPAENRLFRFPARNRHFEKPAAWLRSAIVDDYGEPAGYISRDERDRQRKAAEEKQRQEADRKHRKQEAERLQKEREQAEKQRKAEHLAHIRASLTDAERKEFERLAKIEASDLFRHYFEQNDDHAVTMRGFLIDAQILKKYPLLEPEPAT